MAGITSSGIGSGLDIASLVSQLVSSERAAPDKRLAAAQTQAQTQISALGTFRSVLADFQTAAKALRDGGATKLAAISGDSSRLTATANTAASAGSYSVEIVQLAKTHKLATAAYASSTSEVGTGKLSITVGSDSFTVAVGDGQKTLAGIRDAINAAGDNKGVRASLLNTAAGVRLTLTSTKSGSAGAVTVAAQDANGTALPADGSGLDALSYSGGNPRLAVIDPAQDARIQIDGYDFTSSTNTFSDAVEGVSFTALKAEVGQKVTIDVGQDESAATTAVQNFVTRFNVLNATIATYTRYDTTTKAAAALTGDPVLRGLNQQLRNIVGSSLGTGDLKNFSQLGVSLQSDGSMKFDSTKLLAALKNDAGAVGTLLGTSGYGAKLYSLADGFLDDGGQIAAEVDGANARLKDITKQQAALDTRMDAVEARYKAQFNAMDTLISQLKSTSSYLTQQLANLPGTTSSSSKS